MTAVTDKRPAYVRRLDLEARRSQAELAALEEGLYALRCYLHSSKFAEHRYVSVDDVLLRLEEAQSAGRNASAVIA